MTTTTISTFPSVPTTSHQYPVPKQRHYMISSSNRWSSFAQTQETSLTKFPNYPLLLLLCSSSPTSTSAVEEEGGSPPSDGLPSQPESTPTHDSDSLPPLRGCMACGREEIEKGCNGEGRIQGGIATVPGFGWWPIKAYRPCPGFVASGGRYRRRGQSMDEVAGFGRVERGSSVGEAQSSNKKQGQRRLKR